MNEFIDSNVSTRSIFSVLLKWVGKEFQMKWEKVNIEGRSTTNRVASG
ncbi:MAG: hypothetical protein ACE5HI_04110 [bacterium]